MDQYLQSVQEHCLSILVHEQFGLQNVRRLSPSAEIACQFQSLLVVQSVVKGADCLGTCAEYQVRLFANQVDSYTSVDYAVNMDCELRPLKKQDDSDAAELPFFFKIIFDSQIVSEQKMQRLFVHLKHLIKELADVSCGEQTFMQVRDLLQAACEADTRQVIDWNKTLILPCPFVPNESCVHDLVK